MPRKAKPKRGMWEDTYYVTAYEHARNGLTDAQIAEMLKVDPATFCIWKQKKPALHDALQRARRTITQSKTQQTLDYIYNRLPPHLKLLWDKINLCEHAEGGSAKLEALFKDHGMRARQHLFLHAMIVTNFNASEACRKVGVSKATVDAWVRTDPDFPELLDEILWHKKNFFESALIERVAEGDVNATLFANRTLNRDRGYGESKSIEVSGEVRHSHSHTVTIDPEELGLPFDVARLIYEKLKEHNYKKREPLPDSVLAGYLDEDNDGDTEPYVIEVEPEC